MENFIFRAVGFLFSKNAKIHAEQSILRSNHRRCSVRKDVLKNLAIFTKKTPVPEWSLSYNPFIKWSRKVKWNDYSVEETLLLKLPEYVTMISIYLEILLSSQKALIENLYYADLKLIVLSNATTVHASYFSTRKHYRTSKHYSTAENYLVT